MRVPLPVAWLQGTHWSVRLVGRLLAQAGRQRLWPAHQREARQVAKRWCSPGSHDEAAQGEFYFLFFFIFCSHLYIACSLN